MDLLNEYLLFTGGRHKNDSTLRSIQRYNDLNSQYIYKTLIETWLSRFKWESKDHQLPDWVIPKLVLYNGNLGVCNKTISLGDLSISKPCVGRAVGIDRTSFYGEPVKCQITDLIGRDSQTYVLPNHWIGDDLANAYLYEYDPITYKRPIDNIVYYADRLCRINKAINALIKNLSGTIIYYGTQEQLKDIQKQRVAAENGVPYIIKKSMMDTTSFESLATPDFSDRLDKAFQYYDKVFGDYCESIGLRYNAEQSKMSGVTPLEVTEGRSRTDLLLNKEYESYLVLIDKLSSFGLDVSVDLTNFEPKIPLWDGISNESNTLEDYKETTDESRDESRDGEDD